MEASVLLDLIGDAQGSLDLEEFRACLLDALRRAVPADWISLNDLGPEPGDANVLIEPPFPPEAHAVFGRLAHENPLIERYRRTRDGRAYRFSDVVTPRELHRLALYREFYEPLGLEYQIAFTLPTGPDRLLGVALSRRDANFSDAERELLDQARPFLIQAYRNAIAHSELSQRLAAAEAAPPNPHDLELLNAELASRGLTARQSEMIHWIATGHSSRSVASALKISERTVQKHLELSYRKLGVKNRSEAAALAWSLVEAA